MHIQRKVAKKIENMLDVRNFIRSHINLALLTSMLLTEEQRLLLKHHRARSVSIIKPSSKEGKLPKLPHCEDGGKETQFLLQLLDYRIKRDLDRQLLSGVIDTDTEENQKVLVPIVTRPPASYSTINDISL